MPLRFQGLSHIYFGQFYIFSSADWNSALSFAYPASALMSSQVSVVVTSLEYGYISQQEATAEPLGQRAPPPQASLGRTTLDSAEG